MTKVKYLTFKEYFREILPYTSRLLFEKNIIIQIKGILFSTNYYTNLYHNKTEFVTIDNDNYYRYYGKRFKNYKYKFCRQKIQYMRFLMESNEL